MSIRMAPKPTDKHVTLPPFAAVKVNLATQILSHSVAAGINMLCTTNSLPEDANATAEFIETMDQLFNTFNSASLKSSHKHKNALNDTSGHIPFLDSCFHFLSKLTHTKWCCCTLHSGLVDIYLQFTKSMERPASKWL